jgi:hypothetical protein
MRSSVRAEKQILLINSLPRNSSGTILEDQNVQNLALAVNPQEFFGDLRLQKAQRNLNRGMTGSE